MVVEVGTVVTSVGGGLVTGKVQRNFLGWWKCLYLDLNGVYMCENY